MSIFGSVSNSKNVSKKLFFNIMVKFDTEGATQLSDNKSSAAVKIFIKTKQKSTLWNSTGPCVMYYFLPRP